MFKSIQLHNFQSHLDSTVPLTEGINLITGTSDHGKSSILRAFKWCLFNQPFRDNGLKNDTVSETAPMAVTITLSDGTEITRHKDSVENKYVVSIFDEPLKALGSDVPTEVFDIFNVTDVVLQEQHNPYFLLNEKSSSVAQAFNDMLGLQVMDSCVSIAKQELNTAKNAVKDIVSEVTRVNKEISDLPNIQELVDVESKLNTSFNNMNESKANIEVLASLLQAHLELTSTIDGVTPTITFINDSIFKLDRLKKRIELISNKIIVLERLIVTSKNLKEIIEHSSTSVDIDTLIGMSEELEKNKTNISRLQMLCDSYIQNTNNIASFDKEILECQAEITELMSGYTECPLCNSILS